MNGERGGRVLRTAELTLCCLSVARADGAVESGVAPARREVGKSLMAAFALVALGLVAATTIIVNYQSAVTLEEVIVRGADVHSQEPFGGPWNAQVVAPVYGEGKLDSLGLNLDHWAWDMHPPRNGAFNPVEAAAPLQSLAGRPLVIREYEQPKARLYRHGYSDAYKSRAREVSVSDIIHNPDLVFQQKDTPEAQDNIY